MRTDIRKNAETINGNEIAIIGVSLRFPKSNSTDEFWEHLISKHSLISEVPSERWDKHMYYGDPRNEANKTRSIYGGFVEDVDCFDAAFFNISPREAMFMDPQQRIVMELAWKAIEDAGCNASLLKGSRTGVFMGVCNTDYTELVEKQVDEIDAYIPTGTSYSIISNRISYWFDFKGPSITIDTACAGSLVAIHQAVRSLENGECKMALAGGVNVCLTPRRFIALSRSGMLSNEGRCKAFDENADGYVRAEGGAILLLKPLKVAIVEHDPIYAVIKGIGTNHGGRTNSLTITNPKAHAELIAEVYEKAGVSPDTVSYIETHGPGTPLGDPIEIHGLKMAFNELARNSGKALKAETCGLGSVKTNIGHLEAAAGIAGVIKVIMALKHQILPASIHFRTLNPVINFKDSPFYIVTEAKPWQARLNENYRPVFPRRAGVSSFGFGGSNAHIVIEEYIAPEQSKLESVVVKVSENWVFVPLSAKNEMRLLEYATIMLDYLKKTYEIQTYFKEAQVKERLERKILETISNILQVDNQDLDPQLEFGEYGIEPIHLTKLLERLQTEVQMEIPIAEFMQLNSVGAISSYVSAQYEKTSDVSADYHQMQRRELLNFSYTLQVGRVAMEERAIFLTGSISELIHQLEAMVQGNTNIYNYWHGRIKPGETDGLTVNHEELLHCKKVNDYEKIAQLWVNGYTLDWDMLYPTTKPRRISLPTYPFAKERYWIPQNNHEIKALDNQGQVCVRMKGTVPNKPRGKKLNQFHPLVEVAPRMDVHFELNSNIPNTSSVETLQKELAISLAEVLYIKSENVNIDQKFVDIGLDSIIAVEWVRVVNKQYSMAISTTKVYDYPCIREFAGYLESELQKQRGVTILSDAIKVPVIIEKPQGIILRALSTSSIETPKFETELSSPILLTDLNQLMSSVKLRHPSQTELTTDKTIELDALQNALADSLAEVLYIKWADADFDKKFIDIGLDSIIAVEWIRKINKQYGTSIAATKVYDYPNIREFAALLREELQEITGGLPQTKEKIISPLTIDELFVKVYQGTINVDAAESLLQHFFKENNYGWN